MLFPGDPQTDLLESAYFLVPARALIKHDAFVGYSSNKEHWDKTAGLGSWAFQPGTSVLHDQCPISQATSI